MKKLMVLGLLTALAVLVGIDQISPAADGVGQILPPSHPTILENAMAALAGPAVPAAAQPHAAPAGCVVDCCPENCRKICTPTIEKVKKTDYIYDCRNEDYCLPRCNLRIFASILRRPFGSSGCGGCAQCGGCLKPDGCDDCNVCGPVQSRNILLKKAKVTEECRIKCVPTVAPVCCPPCPAPCAPPAGPKPEMIPAPKGGAVMLPSPTQPVIMQTGAPVMVPQKSAIKLPWRTPTQHVPVLLPPVQLPPASGTPIIIPASSPK